MAVRRTHSNDSREFRQSRKEGGQRVTAHPGFMSISPRSSSANTYSSQASDESKRTSHSGFHNTLTPISSHLMLSGASNSRSRKTSKPSTSKSYPSSEENKCKKSAQSGPRGQIHSQCASSFERDRTAVSRPKSKASSKPSTPYKSDDYLKCRETIQYQINVLKEKYSKLKEDYNAKMEEVSSARVELESAIKEAVDKHRRCEEAEQKAADLIQRVKEAEFDKTKCSSSRDRILEMENQLTIAKQKHDESLGDAVEAKRILQQQLEAVEKMRALYLETEQLAEEQSRKLQILERENERLSEQVSLSMDQAREQFHMQVFELGPLADSVAKLNEGIVVNKEKKSLADKQAEKIQTEIMQLTARNDELKSKLSDLKQQFSLTDVEKAALRDALDSKQEERAGAKKENYALRAKIKDLEEINGDKEMKIHFKESEVVDLSARLETLREECARQISSNKGSLQSARKANLKRLTALEKDLAKTKADECGAEKERDEIQTRLEEQIASLSQNLCQAQEKIKTLQDSLGYINKDRNIKVRRISPRSRL